MPNFQGSVNQALGVAGAFAGLSGITQERREAAKIKKLKKSASSQKDALLENLENTSSDSPEYAGTKETIQYLDEKIGEATRAKFEARPTKKNAQELLKRNIATHTMNDALNQVEQAKVGWEKAQAFFDEQASAYLQEESGYTPNDESRAEQAINRAATQQATRNKRRDFIRDYLSQMETNMGGKVGDMAPDLQKKIAANYSSAERKRIMNQQDKEKGGKK